MRPALTLVTAVTVAVLAACGTSPSSKPPSPTRTPARTIAQGDTYVAIGDSYTAAPYTAQTVANDGCVQSQENYPHQVAAKLGLHLVDVSCGGATTSSITGTQTTSTGTVKRPQIDAVTSDTALVTVSLGGNDGNVIAGLTTTCLAVASSTIAKVAGGHPCTTMDAVAHKAGTGTSDRIIAMEQNLVKALQAITQKAPRARVIVIGYPHSMPSKTCAQYPLAEGDIAWATRVNKELVSAQRHAAKTVGAEFIDLYDVSAGHDICSSDPWEAGEQPTGPAAPFHPYPVEQAQVATALEAALAASPKP